jgi:hypothetical protein
MPKVDYLSSKLSLACHIEVLQSLAWPSILQPLPRVPVLQTILHSFRMVVHLSIFPLEESTRVTSLFKLEAI